MPRCPCLQSVHETGSKVVSSPGVLSVHGAESKVVSCPGVHAFSLCMRLAVK